MAAEDRCVVSQMGHFVSKSFAGLDHLTHFLARLPPEVSYVFASIVHFGRNHVARSASRLRSQKNASQCSQSNEQNSSSLTTS